MLITTNDSETMQTITKITIIWGIYIGYSMFSLEYEINFKRETRFLIYFLNASKSEYTKKALLKCKFHIQH